MIWTLEELSQLLAVDRQQIIDADRRSKNGLLSWTTIHNGYACHEALLPELRKAIAQLPLVSDATKRTRMPRAQLRFRV